MSRKRSNTLGRPRSGAAVSVGMVALMAASVVETIARLRKAGCRVDEAALLPMARVRIDVPPKWIDTYCILRPAPWQSQDVLSCYAVVDGVQVMWSARAGGARHG
jgi:hypothetical protein